MTDNHTPAAQELPRHDDDFLVTLVRTYLTPLSDTYLRSRRTRRMSPPTAAQQRVRLRLALGSGPGPGAANQTRRIIHFIDPRIKRAVRIKRASVSNEFSTLRITYRGQLGIQIRKPRKPGPG